MTIDRKLTIGLIAFVATGLLLFFYRYSPYKVQFLGHYDKIWAHRVNSLEKLESALSYFEGVELDLVYDAENNVLDVNHPPAESIHLNFETYLDNLPQSSQPKLWLDIKNLNRETETAIFQKLNSLLSVEKYNRQNILIETRQPEALPKFTEAGFKTSYYLPPRLYLMDRKSLDSEFRKIQTILDQQPNIAISTDYRDYEIIDKHFPNRKKYIWILVSSFSMEFSNIQNILEDETVEVVLVNYKAFKGNR